MMDDENCDPLDEQAPYEPGRDRKGRFKRGSTGNPNGRRIEIPRDPSLPANRRRVINAVADELVEVKVNGEVRKMSLYEANVRSLALDGTRNRMAAQRFIELANATSDIHLERKLITQSRMEYMDRLEQENEELKRQFAPTSGVVEVPTFGDLADWPPEGLIDDDKRVNMAMVRDLKAKKAREDAAAGEK